MRRYDNYGMRRPQIETNRVFPRFYAPSETSIPEEAELSVIRLPRAHPRAADWDRDEPMGDSPRLLDVHPQLTIPRPSLTQLGESDREREEREQEDRVLASLVPSLVDEQAVALWTNPALGMQRAIFTMTKYPAMALFMVGTFVLWGKGLEVAYIGNEQVSGILCVIASCISLGGLIFLSANHNLDCDAAKHIATVRHLCSLLSGVAALAALVLSSTTLSPLADAKDSCAGDEYCYNTDKRYSTLSVGIGACVLLLVLHGMALVYGMYALFTLPARLEEVRKQQPNHPASTYQIQAMQF